MDYRIQDLVLLFFIYSFLGWCGEVAFAACKNGKFVNRGFLNGPFCPIYGFGILLVALLLEPWQDHFWLLYFGSVVLTTLLELVTGFVMDKLFHTRWWDYSRMPLNIGGYVCLPFSFLWGIACVVILKWVHAPLLALVQRIPEVIAYILSAVLCIALAVDLEATLITIRKLSERLNRLTALAKDIHALSDELGEDIAEHALAAKEKYEEGRGHAETAYKEGRERAELAFETGRERVEALHEANRKKRDEGRSELEHRLQELREHRDALLHESHFGQRRLLEAFPNMKSYQHGEAIEHLRKAIQSRKR